MATQHGSCQDEEQGSPYLADEGATVVTPSRRTWRDAFRDKAVLINLGWSLEAYTRGYKITWFFWSADIWFGRFPLLKFIVGVNVVVWVILFLTA